VNQFGVTVGQSVGTHLVVASTLKLLRGGAASAPVASSSEGLDLGDELGVSRHTRGDLDIGGMATFRHLRVGLTVKNVTEPEFGTDEIALQRSARAGAAVFIDRPNAFASLTLSADADLTRTATVGGDVRHLAAGAEAFVLNRRLGVRGGLTANTVGERRPTSSVGVSVALLKALYLEAARTFGSDRSLEGWSTAVRVTF
jgi:hypothetical protein